MLASRQRWDSTSLGGRPPISAKLRALIQRMSLENSLWGCTEHGELLKLGFTVTQSTVANGMDRPCSRPQRNAESVGGIEEHTQCPAKRPLQSPSGMADVIGGPVKRSRPEYPLTRAGKTLTRSHLIGRDAPISLNRVPKSV